MSIVWSPNNLKLAIASSDRSIYLFDENCVKRDRFSTKPIDSKVRMLKEKLFFEINSLL